MKCSNITYVQIVDVEVVAAMDLKVIICPTRPEVLLGMRWMVRSIGVLMIVLAVTAGLLKQFAVGLPMLLTTMSALRTTDRKSVV